MRKKNAKNAGKTHIDPSIILETRNESKTGGKEKMKKIVACMLSLAMLVAGAFSALAEEMDARLRAVTAPDVLVPELVGRRGLRIDHVR